MCTGCTLGGAGRLRRVIELMNPSSATLSGAVSGPEWGRDVHPVKLKVRPMHSWHEKAESEDGRGGRARRGGRGGRGGSGGANKQVVRLPLSAFGS